MNKYLVLLRHMLVRDTYVQLYAYIANIKLEEELEIILHIISYYYKYYTTKDSICQEEFFLLLEKEYTSHPKLSAIRSQAKRMFELEIEDGLATDVVKSVIHEQAMSQVAQLSLAGMERDPVEAQEEIERVLSGLRDTTAMLDGGADEDPFYERDIDDLVEEMESQEGINWGIPSLDNYLGPLYGGTLGHIFARTNIGKTSFCATLAANFALQLKDDEIVLWCNNEEHPRKVLWRRLTAVSGYDVRSILYNKDAARQAFLAGAGDRIKVFDKSRMSVYEIEALLRRYNVRILMVDIGDKVQMRGKFDSTHGYLEALYQRFRVMTKDYDKMDMITYGQANASVSSDTKWLDETHMANSKTGKPSELDWAIGISGDRSESLEPIERYVKIAKTKVGLGIHARIQMTMDPTTGRYEDI